MHESILLIEDEEALRMTLADRLESEGYVVDYASDGTSGFDKATSLPFDLIILDVMLPKKGGFEVCRAIRQEGLITPILMLTARGETVDKVVGLKLGADDYVTKPFEIIELVARVEALLRRAPSKSSEPAASNQFGSIKLDFKAAEVMKAGRVVKLTARELQLLQYFVDHRNTAISRDELLREVWGYAAAIYTRTVDVHVASLRQKLEDDPKRPSLITTVSGVGYRFEG